MSDRESRFRLTKDQVAEVKSEIGKVNRLRREFWLSYKVLSYYFFDKYPAEDFEDDPQWLQLSTLISDMQESLDSENIKRFHGDRMKSPKHKGKGLYVSEKYCVVCKIPLVGRQIKYCSPKCKEKYKNDKKSPESKEKARSKYWKDVSQMEE